MRTHCSSSITCQKWDIRNCSIFANHPYGEHRSIVFRSLHGSLRSMDVADKCPAVECTIRLGWLPRNDPRGSQPNQIDICPSPSDAHDGGAYRRRSENEFKPWLNCTCGPTLPIHRKLTPSHIRKIKYIYLILRLLVYTAQPPVPPLELDSIILGVC